MSSLVFSVRCFLLSSRIQCSVFRGVFSVFRLPSSVFRSIGRRRRRFTFAEILVALVFVAVLLPVAVRGVLIANRAGAVAEHKQQAVRLADSFLADLVATDSWADTESEGDFGEDWPGYTWQFADEQWQEDDELLRVLTVQVLYRVQGEELSLTLSTLVQDTAADE